MLLPFLIATYRIYPVNSLFLNEAEMDIILQVQFIPIVFGGGPMYTTSKKSKWSRIGTTCIQSMCVVTENLSNF